MFGGSFRGLEIVRDHGRICHFSLETVLLRDKSVIYNSSKRPQPILLEGMRDKLQSGYKHPKSIPVTEPSEQFTKHLLKAFDKSLAPQKPYIQKYLDAGFELNRFLKHRKVPLEKHELQARERKIEKELEEDFQFNPNDVSDESAQKFKKMKAKEKRLKGNITKWAPIEFDSTGALVYLLSRSPAEFAGLTYIFNQIREKLPDFKPNSFFDFGSGVGTGLWAFRQIFGEVHEAFCVDPGKEMNDLARTILGESSLPPNISFRMHCPSIINLQYSLVLASHSLSELPTLNARLETLNSLWERVEPGGCLVIQELGTNAGFQLLTEARDYLRQVAGHPEEEGGGHVLAPCPHDLPCQRFLKDSIPCNFPVKYRLFNLDSKNTEAVQKVFTELISYVVFRKGAREDCVAPLPRLVEETVKTKGNTYCRLCTPGGNLQEVIVRKKDDQDLYLLSKRLRYGDEMSVTLNDFDENKPKVGMPWLKKRADSRVQ